MATSGLIMGVRVARGGVVGESRLGMGSGDRHVKWRVVISMPALRATVRVRKWNCGQRRLR